VRAWLRIPSGDAKEASVSRFGFVGGRTLQAIPVILGVTLISFFVLRLIPGDPTIVMLGTHWTPARAAQLRTNLGLNQPVWKQYYLFMDHLVHGNLGQSIYYRAPVAHLIAQRLPVTLWLTMYSTVIAVLIGIPLATVSALRQNGVIDQGVRGTFLLAFAMPPFWVGLILILVFSLHLGVFPVSGYGSDFVQHLYNLFLPSLTIALGFAAILIRTLRNGIIGISRADYIDTARAKGLRPRRLLTRHILRNAMLTAVTVLGVNLSYLIGSTVVIENVFALPGLGQLLASSIFTRDLSVVQGITLVFGALVVLINLGTDIAYAALDPRVAFD
jgi:peptide/nickel transport system permease protein